MNHPKLSIIITVYNDENNIKRCLDSVLNQTYKNIEIIIANNNIRSIAENCCLNDNRIKFISNKGLFNSILEATKVATGEYIAFLDSNNYVTVDYYRSLIYSAYKNDSDIVLGNIILENNNAKKNIYNISDITFKRLQGEEIIDSYFSQEGLNFAWHILDNKIYKMKLWKNAAKHYCKMNKFPEKCVNFVFSTILFYYAKIVTRVENDGLYYHNNQNSKLTNKKVLEIIRDLIISFNNVEEFMKEENVYDKYEIHFLKWKALYKQKINSLGIGFKEDEINKKLEEFSEGDKQIQKLDYFYSIQTEWNDTYENIKKMICNPKIKYVSFDIFDTLIVRPFFYPSDLFTLLDDKFRKIANYKTGVDFSEMRKCSEEYARRNTDSEEITFNDIYNTMSEEYDIPKDILEKMKQIEIEMELRFCSTRKSTYQLYEMALELGKKVICISDIYFTKQVIEKLLLKNGYDKIDKIYVSSEIKLRKKTGNLYKYVKEDLGINSNEIIHIGDNYEADIVKAKENKIEAIHFRKATDVFMDSNFCSNLGQIFVRKLPTWQGNTISMRFLGIRCMIAVVANMYFDNPYRTFNKKTDFNADSYLIGYYALGMHLLGLTKWLLDDMEKKNYDKIIFMARDGYLPMESYKIMKDIYTNVAEEAYLYISRKASMPLIIMNKIDFYKLSEIISIKDSTPKGIMKYLKSLFEIDNEKLENICKDASINLEEKFIDKIEFNRFISILVKNFFDENKHKMKLQALKEYFCEILEGKTCVFDIGYSARPELFLSILCEKEIDTYFVAIQSEEAYKHAKLGNFNLNLFYDYTPALLGLTREILFSKCAPSCIEYAIDGNKAQPIFEEYEQSYQEGCLIKQIQNASLDFIRDMVTIFGEDLKTLYFQKYDISMPYEMFTQSANEIDRKIVDCIIFEDDIRISRPISVAEEWSKEIKKNNQRCIKELF